MRDIGTCSIQKLAGHTTEISNLPKVGDTLEDGTIFKGACGSTFLDVDTGNVFIFYDGDWYAM